jgi:GMP synthase-like glutamine amidotransferase
MAADRSPVEALRDARRVPYARRPVLVLQHVHIDGPAYLGAWLARRGVPFEVRNAEAGDAFPADMRGHRALAILGGPMSANDPLPSLRQAERLVRDAVERGRPVIGHCLGGQLMARALGARVGPSPAPEIGWQPVEIIDAPLAAEWFGAAQAHTVFQWHYEAFDLPAGAQWLATSAACRHQAFALGPHLALQFHVELDAAKLAAWTASRDAQYEAAQRLHRSVQAPREMLAQATQALPAQQDLADAPYRRWLGA